MAIPPPSGPTTLAVILGAQAWPDMPSLCASNSFALSAAAFKSYLQAAEGLALPASCIMDFFDTELPRDQIDLELRRFIESHSADGKPGFANLIIYYTGHGDFTRGDQYFQLILRSTHHLSSDFSGYTMRQLAGTINGSARKARKFVFLDCCYAAAAFRDWQMQGLNEIKSKISLQATDNFPDNPDISGTALVCACDAQDWALFRDDAPTMFSGGLISALRQGDSELGASLSINDIYLLTRSHIFSRHESHAVAPILHVPKGRQEEMTSYRLFPNPAHRIGVTVSQLEAEATSASGSVQAMDPEQATASRWQRPAPAPLAPGPLSSLTNFGEFLEILRNHSGLSESNHARVNYAVREIGSEVFGYKFKGGRGMLGDEPTIEKQNKPTLPPAFLASTPDDQFSLLNLVEFASLYSSLTIFVMEGGINLESTSYSGYQRSSKDVTSQVFNQNRMFLDLLSEGRALFLPKNS